MIKLLLSLTTLVLFTSCGTTGYQPKKGNSSGYTDMSVGNNMYKVSYEGNSTSSAETIYNYFLRRCAELTIEKGFHFFTFIDQSGTSKTRMNTTSLDLHYDPYYRRGYGRYYYPYYPQVYSTTEHSHHGVIKLYKEGTQPETALDAKEVLKNFEGEEKK